MTPEDVRDDPVLGPALRVLQMVGELHALGRQRIRIMPGMSSSGMYWRCAVTHVGNILRSHGAMALHFDRESAHYTTGQGDEFFGWTDARDDSPRELADKFLARFPEIARMGQGVDQPYADWYAQMLQLADRGEFPIAYADFFDDSDPARLPTIGAVKTHLSMPPGGEAVPPD